MHNFTLSVLPRPFRDEHAQFYAVLLARRARAFIPAHAGPHREDLAESRLVSLFLPQFVSTLLTAFRIAHEGP